jgi:spore coat protein A
VLEYTDNPMIEYYGNTVSVNGKLWPHLDVEPKKYRFRIVNGSNARSYSMRVTDINEVSGGPAIYQIGSDSGFLEKTVVLNDPADPKAPRLFLAPGERADVIVDFTQFAGQTLLLHNTSRDPGDGEIAMPELMQFRVAKKGRGKDTSSLPMVMAPIERIPESSAINKDNPRRIVFGETEYPSGDTMSTLNGKAWHDPVEEKPVLGTTEIWSLINTLPDVHPFHIHVVQFQVLDRTPYDVEEFLKTGEIKFTGPPEMPDLNEMGWKDTVRLHGQMITRIITKFLPYPGFYVYHCHILEHEDMDMMRPFQVVEPTATH